MKSLLGVFEQEATLTLLFLKYLEKLSLFESLQSLQQNNPEFQVSLGGSNIHDIKRARSDMQGKCIPPTPVVREYRMKVETYKKGQGRQNREWLVVNRLEGCNEASSELLDLSKSLSYLPYAGVAALVDSESGFTGHVFCFVPLPMPQDSITKLPVHIHGQFALSQNRQHLKWADRFTVNFKEKSVQWNECLVSEILPKAYTSLIQYMVRHGQAGSNLVMRCLPDPDRVESPF